MVRHLPKVTRKMRVAQIAKPLENKDCATFERGAAQRLRHLRHPPYRGGRWWRTWCRWWDIGSAARWCVGSPRSAHTHPQPAQADPAPTAVGWVPVGALHHGGRPPGFRPAAE
ncbi:hypothetical protein ABIA41_006071 [Bradyrhizobium sp. USDA 313]